MYSAIEHVADHSTNSYLMRDNALQMVKSYSPFLWVNHPIQLAVRVVCVGAIVTALCLKCPIIPVLTMEALKSYNWIDIPTQNPDSYRFASITISVASGIFASVLACLYLRWEDQQIQNWKDRTEWKLKSWDLNVFLTKYQLKSICEDAPESFGNELIRFGMGKQL